MSKPLPPVSIQSLDDIRRAEKETPTKLATVPAPDLASADLPSSSLSAEPRSVARRLVLSAGAGRARHDFGGKSRRSCADAIVRQYSGYGALSGIAIMPWLKAVAVSIVAERMIRAISVVYDQPSSADYTTRLTAALISGLTISGISGLTSGRSLAGMALSSAGSFLVLQALGHRYIENLETGKAGAADNWRMATNGE